MMNNVVRCALRAVPKAPAANACAGAGATPVAATAARCMSTNADFLTFKKGSTQRNVFHYATYSLAALVPAGVFLGGGAASVADMVLAVTIPLHAHIGMRSVILDYVKPDSVQKASLIAATAFSALMLVGLVTFNAKDVGMIEGTKMLWRAPAKKKAE